MTDLRCLNGPLHPAADGVTLAVRAGFQACDRVQV